MVVNKAERNKKLEDGEEVRKRRLLEALSKESVDVITLACMYAKSFERYGTADIETLQRVYNKGYEDGLRASVKDDRGT